LGVTDVIVGFRWPYVPGQDTETLQTKIDNLRRFSDDVIAKASMSIRRIDAGVGGGTCGDAMTAEALTARELGIRSRAAVHAGDREGWLDLFADDGGAGPIGPSPSTPRGRGITGARPSPPSTTR
jgi:hypothetical protein